jgi:anti-sigma B factor antagonist
MVTHFSVDSGSDGAMVRVVLEGELDLASVMVFEDALQRVEADHPEAILIDLSGLTFMDSSGLRALVMADERARAGKRRLAIVPGPPQVRRVFEITQLDERLELVDDASTV